MRARGLICHFNLQRDVISPRVSGEPNAQTLLSMSLACDVENLENDKASGETVCNDRPTL